MDCNRIRIVEVLALKTPQSLRDVCDVLQTGFHLADFSFVAEAEGEWALTNRKGIEYCISRPYQPIAWEVGGSRAGADCNVCIALMVEEEDAPGVEWEAVLKERTPRVAQGLADALGEPVIHHLTWRPDRPMVLHERVFWPASLTSDPSPLHSGKRDRA
jgi:hypothetical protein